MKYGLKHLFWQSFIDESGELKIVEYLLNNTDMRQRWSGLRGWRLDAVTGV